jgi:hypothetical protein
MLFASKENTKTPVANALFGSHSDSEYRKLISDLFDNDKSTGKQQSSELTNYSGLSETCMNRLEKTMIISEEIILEIKILEKGAYFVSSL